jgi:hypothetical protein
MVFLGKNLSKESFETSHCLQGSVIRVPDSEMDDAMARILTTYDTIAVVGASAHPVKAARRVPR